MVKSVFDWINDRKTDKHFIIITLFHVQKLAAIRIHHYEKDP